MRFLSLIACLATPVSALDVGQRCTEDAMIVFDGSGSMSGIAYSEIGIPRIVEARSALHRVLPSVGAMRRLGLVVYGPSGDRTCRNISLRFEPEWEAAPRILDEVDRLRPAGGTPLTEAVERAAETLDYEGTVVLVTDGQETCQGAPCELAARLRAKAPGLVVHVIGYKLQQAGAGRSLGLDRSPSADCLAHQTGGHYVDANTAEELARALRITLACNQFSALP